MLDLRPFADTRDESEGFGAGDGGGEGGGHVIVGFREGDFFVFDDGVNKAFAVAAFDDDFVASVELVEVLEDAFDVGAAVVTVDDEDAAVARSARLVIPAGVEDVVRGVEFASGVDAHGHDASVDDAEFGDGKVAGVVGWDGVFGALFDGNFDFFDWFGFGDGFDGGAGATFFFGVVVVFPDGGASEEESEAEEDEAEEDFADEGAGAFKVHAAVVGF